MQNYRYRYLPLAQHTDLAENHEIRLVKLFPGTYDADIEIDIIHRELPNAKYEALSYCWGSPERTHVVFTRERGPRRPGFLKSRRRPNAPNPLPTLQITYNLSVALRHLRRLKNPRVLWIDSISINQDDITERSREVLNMNIIFSKAQRVIVWLGPSEQNSTLAIQTLRRIASGIDTRPEGDTQTYINGKPGSWTADLTVAINGVTNIPFIMSNKDSWLAIERLVCRPWFSRLWVFQEVLLARSAVVVVGEATLEWRLLMYALEWWLSGKTRVLNNLIPELSAILLERRKLEGYVYMAVYGNNRKYLDITDAILRTHEHLCHDPRDRLFAIRSVLMPRDRECIRPDYSAPVEEAYKSATLSWIHAFQRRNLWEFELLILCFLPVKQSTLELPSWVPDFSLQERPHNFHFDTNLYTYPQYTKPVVHYNKADDSLLLQGVKVATLTNIAPFNLNHTSSETETLKAFDSRIRVLLSHNTRLEHKTLHRLIRTLLLRQDYGHPIFIPLQEWEMSLTNHVSRSYGMSILLTTMRNNMIGRALFSTNAGHLGACSETVQCGDEIFQILGFRFPIVLRPTYRGVICYHRIVGICFIPELMHTEVFLGPLAEEFSGKWKPGRSRLRSDDPRLSSIPLPPGWVSVPKWRPNSDKKGPPEFERFEKPGTEERSWYDPRLSIEELRKRNVDIQDIFLI